MKQEIESGADIAALSRRWDTEAGGRKKVIERIEDLPSIEQLAGAKMEWVVDGIFAKGALHMITSEPGAGKSTFVAAVGYSVAHGLPFMGRATKRRPVLLLDAENPLPAVSERFVRLKITTDEHFRVWGQWVGKDPPAAGGATVQEWVMRCDPKPLIIVDSVIAFHPGTENDSNETRKYMTQYMGLTAMGATVLLLHHTGKSETSKDYRGSSDYKASIDIGYKLTSFGDGMRLSMLELKPFKQRFSVKPGVRILYNDGSFSLSEPEPRKGVTEMLGDLLKAHPGTTKSDFEQFAADQELGRNRARDFLANGIKGGTVRVETGPRNRHLHYWVERPN